MAYADKTDGSRIILEGLGKVHVLLAEAVKPGDLIGLSAGTWKLADGNNSIFAELVAGEGGANAATIVAYRQALVRHADSGGAKGDLLYLSDTAGGTGASAGTVAQVVGQVINVVASTYTDYLLAPQYSGAVGGQLIPGATKLFFRDSGLYVQSGADGKLTISADGTGADDITLGGTVQVDDNITIADAKNIIVNATTGTKIGTATTQKLGFFNATPADQPSAYTQTYATGDKTHANPTAVALTDNSGGTASGTIAAIAAAGTYADDDDAIKNGIADLASQVNKLIDDLADTKQLVNSVIDDLQELGLVG
ncbi:MAG: hypothetical protein HY673_12000 [Chloroflexi bacterium]|nr:hypothetical protein [Chloroflexota bacterium]